MYINGSITHGSDFVFHFSVLRWCVLALECCLGLLLFPLSWEYILVRFLATRSSAITVVFDRDQH